MAVEGQSKDLWSYKAAADLSTHQYKLVKLDGSGELVLAGAGEGALVLDDAPKTGEYGSVVVGGVSKVKLGGTVAALGLITPNASSLGVQAVAGNVVAGQVLEAGVSGDVVTFRSFGGMFATT